MGRAPCCDKANVKRGPWSPEEDAKLKDYIHKYGTGGNWIALPHKSGLKRCGKSCRLRWLNYLRPNIKHGEFSFEEDRIICSLYASIGSRWSIIAAQLPGRTDNDIKNYWNTKLKKKLLGNSKNNNIISSSSTTSQNILKKHIHNNNNQNPMIISPLLSSQSSPLSYPYNYTNTPYYNSMTMSFSNNNISLSHPPFTMQGKDNSTLLMFGGDQQQPSTTTCSSSDGSCSIKCEDHDNINNINILGLYNNGINQVHQEEDQKPSLVDDNSMLWGQVSHPSNNNALLEYGLEEIKQLISSTNNDDVNYLDENKVMYYY